MHWSRGVSSCSITYGHVNVKLQRIRLLHLVPHRIWQNSKASSRIPTWIASRDAPILSNLSRDRLHPLHFSTDQESPWWNRQSPPVHASRGVSIHLRTVPSDVSNDGYAHRTYTAKQIVFVSRPFLCSVSFCTHDEQASSHLKYHLGKSMFPVDSRRREMTEVNRLATKLFHSMIILSLSDRRHSGVGNAYEGMFVIHFYTLVTASIILRSSVRIRRLTKPSRCSIAKEKNCSN